MQQAHFFGNARASPLPFHRQLYNNPIPNFSKSPFLENEEKVSHSSNKNFHEMRNSMENFEKAPEQKEENTENPGNNLIDFKILEELGKGSYGIVYRVRSLINKKEYVIKKIDLKILNAKHRKESLQEVQLLKKLSHPNMIKYFNSFLEKEILFIVMEYAEGGDLQKLIRTKKENKETFSEQEVWSLAYELLQAINHLHSNNIIHRDIKTLNVFLSKNQQVKLGDLGVSKIVSQAGVFEGTRVGTPLYLAPELVQNRPYDYKIDIWALGCVLYHLTNFEPPFIGENLISLGYNIVNKPPKPLNSMYSLRLANFIFRLLEKNPAKRPKVMDLIREIELYSRKNTREEKKSEKIEVSNEREYLMMKKNIMEEKANKYRKIHEKFNKIEGEKIEKNASAPLFPEKKNSENSNNNNNLVKFESLSQIKTNKNSVNLPKNPTQNSNNEFFEEKLPLEKKETKNLTNEKNEWFFDKKTEKSPLKTENLQEKSKKTQDPLQNNFMNIKPDNNNNNNNQEKLQNNEFLSRKITEIDQKEKEQLSDQRPIKQEKKKSKKEKKIHTIFEIKNPKNINCLIFPDKNPHTFKSRPVSATFKPNLRSSENFYPQIKKLQQQNQESLSKSPEILQNLQKLPEKQRNPVKKFSDYEEPSENASKSPFLMRPKSAMLQYSRQFRENSNFQEMKKSKIVETHKISNNKAENVNNLEEYSQTKGIKPQLKYDGNYIDNDETKKYRNNEIFKESAAEGIPPHRGLIRPQTAVIRGDNTQRKKLTIYDLF